MDSGDGPEIGNMDESAFHSFEESLLDRYVRNVANDPPRLKQMSKNMSVYKWAANGRYHRADPARPTRITVIYDGKWGITSTWMDFCTGRCDGIEMEPVDNWEFRPSPVDSPFCGASRVVITTCGRFSEKGSMEEPVMKRRRVAASSASGSGSESPKPYSRSIEFFFVSGKNYAVLDPAMRLFRNIDLLGSSVSAAKLNSRLYPMSRCTYVAMKWVGSAVHGPEPTISAEYLEIVHEDRVGPFGKLKYSSDNGGLHTRRVYRFNAHGSTSDGADSPAPADAVTYVENISDRDFVPLNEVFDSAEDELLTMLDEDRDGKNDRNDIIKAYDRMDEFHKARPAYSAKKCYFAASESEPWKEVYMHPTSIEVNLKSSHNYASLFNFLDKFHAFLARPTTTDTSSDMQQVVNMDLPAEYRLFYTAVCHSGTLNIGLIQFFESLEYQSSSSVGKWTARKTASVWPDKYNFYMQQRVRPPPGSFLSTKHIRLFAQVGAWVYDDTLRVKYLKQNPNVQNNMRLVVRKPVSSISDSDGVSNIESIYEVDAGYLFKRNETKSSMRIIRPADKTVTHYWLGGIPQISALVRKRDSGFEDASDDSDTGPMLPTIEIHHYDRNFTDVSRTMLDKSGAAYRVDRCFVDRKTNRWHLRENGDAPYESWNFRENRLTVKYVQGVCNVVRPITDFPVLNRFVQLKEHSSANSTMPKPEPEFDSTKMPRKIVYRFENDGNLTVKSILWVWQDKSTTNWSSKPGFGGELPNVTASIQYTAHPHPSIVMNNHKLQTRYTARVDPSMPWVVRREQKTCQRCDFHCSDEEIRELENEDNEVKFDRFGNETPAPRSVPDSDSDSDSDDDNGSYCDLPPSPSSDWYERVVLDPVEFRMASSLGETKILHEMFPAWKTEGADQGRLSTVADMIGPYFAFMKSRKEPRMNFLSPMLFSIADHLRTAWNGHVHKSKFDGRYIIRVSNAWSNDANNYFRLNRYIQQVAEQYGYRWVAAVAPERPIPSVLEEMHPMPPTNQAVASAVMPVDSISIDEGLFRTDYALASLWDADVDIYEIDTHDPSIEIRKHNPTSVFGKRYMYTNPPPKTCELLADTADYSFDLAKEIIDSESVTRYILDLQNECYNLELNPDTEYMRKIRLSIREKNNVTGKEPAAVRLHRITVPWPGLELYVLLHNKSEFLRGSFSRLQTKYSHGLWSSATDVSGVSRNMLAELMKQIEPLFTMTNRDTGKDVDDPRYGISKQSATDIVNTLNENMRDMYEKHYRRAKDFGSGSSESNDEMDDGQNHESSKRRNTDIPDYKWGPTLPDEIKFHVEDLLPIYDIAASIYAYGLVNDIPVNIPLSRYLIHFMTVPGLKIPIVTAETSIEALKDLSVFFFVENLASRELSLVRQLQDMYAVSSASEIIPNMETLMDDYVREFFFMEPNVATRLRRFCGTFRKCLSGVIEIANFGPTEVFKMCCSVSIPKSSSELVEFLRSPSVVYGFVQLDEDGNPRLIDAVSDPSAPTSSAARFRDIVSSIYGSIADDYFDNTPEFMRRFFVWWTGLGSISTSALTYRIQIVPTASTQYAAKASTCLTSIDIPLKNIQKWTRLHDSLENQTQAEKTRRKNEIRDLKKLFFSYDHYNEFSMQ